MRSAIAIATVVFAFGALGQERILWRDPGEISKLDLAGPVAAGVPVPKLPFSFVKEDTSGTQPKMNVRDAAGVVWNVKFGNEVKPESFTWRLPRVVGYFVSPSFFIAEGTFEHLGTLTRQTDSVSADGHFTNARFQYRDPSIRLVKETWTWTENPFRGTPQLHGLEILIMLASNWDNKDGRTGLDGTNTLVFEHDNGSGRELFYSFSDWGSGMGAWGDKAGQTDWNCADYTRQSASFVRGVTDGHVQFGYEGHVREGFQTEITPGDVAWLLKYLGQISDDQLRAALRASGASEHDETCFAAAIRVRIDALRRVAQ